MAIEIKVRCLNKIHKIVLADNGQLCLCDHGGAKGIEEINALMALGLGEPRCLQIFNWWKQNKLTDVEAEKMPARLLKVWKIMHRNKKACRLLRRKVRKRGEPLFDDLTVAKYPDDIDTTIPEGVDPNDPIVKSTSGGYTNLWDRKRHVFAIQQLVQELERRGYKNIEYTASYKRSKNWKGELAGWADFCSVYTIGGCNTFCKVAYGNSTRGSFSFDGNDVSIITTRDVPYKMAADIIELQIYQWYVTQMRNRRELDKNARFYGIVDKLKQVYPQRLVTVETNSKDDYLHMKLHLMCKDKLSAVFIMDALRSSLDRLHKQNRVYWGKPP